MDVLRLNISRLSTLMVLGLILFSTSCQKTKHETAKEIQVSAESKQKVLFEKVLLRIENETGKESKLAQVDFEFYGTEKLPESFESQKTEIRNLILIHFANSNFKEIPKTNLKIKDPKLSAYLNQFLSEGQIDEAEYKLVKVY